MQRHWSNGLLVYTYSSTICQTMSSPVPSPARVHSHWIHRRPTLRDPHSWWAMLVAQELLVATTTRHPGSGSLVAFCAKQSPSCNIRQEIASSQTTLLAMTALGLARDLAHRRIALH